MASPYWDEELAARFRQFRYEFAERALADRVIAVAGGTGGLGAAVVTLLARDGARLGVGYRANRERAQALSRAIAAQFCQKLPLGEGDPGGTAVRTPDSSEVRQLGQRV